MPTSPEWVKRAKAAGYSGAGYAPKARTGASTGGRPASAKPRVSLGSLYDRLRQALLQPPRTGASTGGRPASAPAGQTLAQVLLQPQRGVQGRGVAFQRAPLLPPPLSPQELREAAGTMRAFAADMGSSRLAGPGHPIPAVSRANLAASRLRIYYAGLGAVDQPYAGGGGGYYYPQYYSGGGYGAPEKVKEWLDALYRWDI